MNYKLLGVALAIGLSSTPVKADTINSVPFEAKYNLGGQNVISLDHTNRIVVSDSLFSLQQRQEADHQGQMAKRRSDTSVRYSRDAIRDEGNRLCRESWSEENCQAIDQIIQRESGWVVGRWNNEGCAGLAQACPASKLGDAYGSLDGELKWSMNYAINRYGSAKKAWEIWQEQRWW